MFKKAYGRRYTSSEEKKRFQIFANNLVKIDNLMANRKGSVVYGVGPFADLTSEEYMASIGAIRRRDGSTRTARLQPRMLNSFNRSRRRRSGSAPPTPTPRRAPSQQSSHRGRGNSVPPSYRTSPFGTLHYVGREPLGSPLIDWRVPANLYPPTETQVCNGSQAKL
ncbi:uncharacterized protein [Bemisia tabaci]|uniref:uncharacterized protein n=1 Tax=Bemisia tabaci TaxID=7038 RepID=UPI003B27BE9D